MDTGRRRLRIDMVVPGRFHAFDLARALIARGHDLRVITNYPPWVPARWGLPRDVVRGSGWNGVLFKLYYRLRDRLRLPDLEPWLHRSFGRWAARQLRPDTDAVHVFSGVAQEVFDAMGSRARPIRLLARGSSHIRTQQRLLQEEELRSGEIIDKPTEWKVQREEREYAAADRIVVLSSFARDSFLQQGVPATKVVTLSLAADVDRFLPVPVAVAQRCRRIIAGEPLRVLMAGSFSHRKGALDFIAAARNLRHRMRFRFVGDLPAPGSALDRLSKGVVEMLQRVSEPDLAAQYAWADLFCLPTIEDGYAVVIAQALMARLPVIATPNSAAPDLIQDGRNGWVVPIRQAQTLCERLQWCDANRQPLAAMVGQMTGSGTQRTWDDVAREFEGLVHE